MNVVAVTSCPTGIAHSQMAAENVEQTAEKRGDDIKVEVQGAMGAENELSDDDIAAADVVIIAADTSVQQDRFEGKPLVKGTVKDAVNDPDALFDRAAAEAGVEGAESSAGAATGTEVEATTDESETSAAESEPEGGSSDPERRAGDPSKGLIARLKRLFS